MKCEEVGVEVGGLKRDGELLRSDKAKVGGQGKGGGGGSENEGRDWRLLGTVSGPAWNHCRVRQGDEVHHLVVHQTCNTTTLAIKPPCRFKETELTISPLCFLDCEVDFDVDNVQRRRELVIFYRL